MLAQAGMAGWKRSRIPASSGVRSAFRLLQAPQAAIVFIQVLRLPWETGWMWSTVPARPLQNPQRRPSRARTPAFVQPGPLPNCHLVTTYRMSRTAAGSENAQVPVGVCFGDLADEHPDRVAEADPLQGL